MIQRSQLRLLIVRSLLMLLGTYWCRVILKLHPLATCYRLPRCPLSSLERHIYVTHASLVLSAINSIPLVIWSDATRFWYDCCREVYPLLLIFNNSASCVHAHIGIRFCLWMCVTRCTVCSLYTVTLCMSVVVSTVVSLLLLLHCLYSRSV